MKESQYLGIPVRELREVEPELYNRVLTHIGPEFLGWTPAQIANYVDGGEYGGIPDPRSLRANRTLGRWTAIGGSGPTKKA